MNLSNIEDLEFIDTGLRLFTETPYPEFDYIVTPMPYEYCGNQSLFAYLRRDNYWLKWVEVTPDKVLEYVTEQIAILRYNNPEATKSQVLIALHKIFRWGTENPLDKIAYETLEATLSTVFEIDNYEDIINMTEKNVWYSDRIMKPPRILGETWKEYTERLRQGKVKARSQFKNMEARFIVEEESFTFQDSSGGVIPTPQILNKLTEIPVRKIKEVSEEDRVWQTKTKMNLQIICNLRKSNPNITQKDMAEILGMTDRQVRKLLTLLI